MRINENLKISFHTLNKRLWKTKENEETQFEPFLEVSDVLNYVIKLSKTKRFLDLKGNKFCFLDSFQEVSIDDRQAIYQGLFKGARNEFRPDLINKRTGNERKNPKEITEGDIEKTHFSIKIDKIEKEVFLFLENNFYGVSINSFVDYLKPFTRKYLKSKKKTCPFTIIHMEILMNSFLTELERLKRTTQAIVYFDKQLLGSEYLNFSNRFISVKRDLMLTAKAEIKDSITEVAVDVFNKMNHKGSLISRMRVLGVDCNDNEVLLDTTKICRREYITVDINQETGDVNTSQVYTGLKQIANSF